eukprot:gene959-10918_t
MREKYFRGNKVQPRPVAGGVGVLVRRGIPARHAPRGDKDSPLYRALWDTGRFQHVVVSYGDGRQSVHILNFYGYPVRAAELQDDDSPDTEAATREALIAQIFEYAASLGDVPKLLLGDFNSDAGRSAAMHAALSSGAWCDVALDDARMHNTVTLRKDAGKVLETTFCLRRPDSKSEKCETLVIEHLEHDSTTRAPARYTGRTVTAVNDTPVDSAEHLRRLCQPLSNPLLRLSEEPPATCYKSEDNPSRIDYIFLSKAAAPARGDFRVTYKPTALPIATHCVLEIDLHLAAYGQQMLRLRTPTAFPVEKWRKWARDDESALADKLIHPHRTDWCAHVAATQTPVPTLPTAVAHVEEMWSTWNSLAEQYFTERSEDAIAPGSARRHHGRANPRPPAKAFVGAHQCGRPDGAQTARQRQLYKLAQRLAELDHQLQRHEAVGRLGSLPRSTCQLWDRIHRQLQLPCLLHDPGLEVVRSATQVPRRDAVADAAAVAARIAHNHTVNTRA